MKLRIFTLTVLLGVGTLAACTAQQPIEPSASPRTSVQVPEAGITFEPPQSWESPTNWVWIDPDDSAGIVGFQWGVIAPPNLPETVFLPANALVRKSGEMNLDWASGRWYEVEVYLASAEGEVNIQIQTFEKHYFFTFIRNDQRIGLDFYASALSLEELNALDATLNHMLHSATLSD